MTHSPCARRAVRKSSRSPFSVIAAERFARRQAGGQPFARVGIDRERQRWMAGMAPRIITPRRSRCRRRSCPRRAILAGARPGPRCGPAARRCRRTSRAHPGLDLRVHVQLAHLDGRLLEDVGQRELEPFGAALERGVGRAGGARLSVWMKSPGSPARGTARTAAQRRPLRARRPGQSAHGQVGGQLGELAVVQLQPGAAAQAAGHGSAGSQADQASGSRSSACR